MAAAATTTSCDASTTASTRRPCRGKSSAGARQGGHPGAGAAVRGQRCRGLHAALLEQRSRVWALNFLHDKWEEHVSSMSSSTRTCPADLSLRALDAVEQQVQRNQALQTALALRWRRAFSSTCLTTRATSTTTTRRTRLRCTRRAPGLPEARGTAHALAAPDPRRGFLEGWLGFIGGYTDTPFRFPSARLCG